MTADKGFTDIGGMDEEQLPIPRHKLGDLAKQEGFTWQYVELLERLYANPDISVLMREVRKEA